MIGLIPLALRRLVEGDGAVEGAVVGQGEAVEALRGRRIDEVRDPPEPVEEAELGVDVEVREVVRARGSSRGVNGSRGGRLGGLGEPSYMSGMVVVNPGANPGIQIVATARDQAGDPDEPGERLAPRPELLGDGRP